MTTLNDVKNINTQLRVIYLICSVGAHAILIIAFLLGAKIDIIFSKRKVIKVPPSVKVDIVAMPNLTFKELEELSVSKSQIEESKPEKKIKLESENTFLKKGKKSFMNLLKKLSKRNIKKEKKSKSQKKGNKVSKIKSKQLKNLLIAGNKLSKGTALTGKTNDALSDLFTGYISALPDIIRPFWKLPSYLIKKELRCRIRVYISPMGRLIKTEIYESSGDSIYDDRALKAIRDVKKFPDVDKSIQHKLIEGSVLIGFPL